ncbi:AAA family ATPase [Candidatus Parcubacteria bacterium]|nr:AAA family ATPase [Candidatus Parcubacteria bacterium]
MKIAFLGKGGSGKSTMATALVRHLHSRGMRVLAIDADHNMDLSYNLGADPKVFLGTDPDRIKEYVGAERSGGFFAAVKIAEERGICFSLSPLDPFTQSVSVEIEPLLHLMTAGPHTDRVRSLEACSHSLAAPLKTYLPLLRLNPKEAVVIDERAGTDPVATGILKGVDLGVIVREDTVNSRRVAEQIKQELEIADIPCLIIDNKVTDLVADTKAAIEKIDSFFVSST